MNMKHYSSRIRIIKFRNRSRFKEWIAEQSIKDTFFETQTLVLNQIVDTFTIIGQIRRNNITFWSFEKNPLMKFSFYKTYLNIDGCWEQKFINQRDRF